MPDERRPSPDTHENDAGLDTRLRTTDDVDLDERLEERLSDQLDDDLLTLETAEEVEAGGQSVGAAAAATAAVGGGLAVERPGSLWGDAWRELRRSPKFLLSVGTIAVLCLLAAFPGVFTTIDPRDCDITQSRLRPSAEHWFGTDVQGCDYYTQVIYGTRVSVMIGILSAGSAALIGVILGTVSGYYGRLTDAIIARLTDIWFGVPYILGAIVVLTVLGTRGILQITLVIAAVGWPTMLRLMRGSVLSAKSHDYVMAARGLGASSLRIMSRHILPNAVAPVVVYATIYVGIAIAAEAALSFLGAGLQLPAISWGLMISVAQTRILNTPHLLLFPGLFLSVTVLSFVLLGDTLRDALDPKLR